MDRSTEHKIDALFWDLKPVIKKRLLADIHQDPLSALKDETVLLRLLETLNWYELISLVGARNLYNLLSDSTLSRLFPPARRVYYSNGKRLLSKYIISLSG